MPQRLTLLRAIAALAQVSRRGARSAPQAQAAPACSPSLDPGSDGAAARSLRRGGCSDGAAARSLRRDGRSAGATARSLRRDGRSRRIAGVPIAGLVLVTLSAAAWALPPVGGTAPRVAVDDVAAGKLRPLPDARPVLVMYEDKEAQTQNDRARQLLGRINDRAENRALLRVRRRGRRGARGTGGPPSATCWRI